ncbi:MAG: TolC family protein [Syntrophomonadaceae bacterium]|nr:TolC family protein [Syntrophomonadaceae bacterium]
MTMRRAGGEWWSGFRGLSGAARAVFLLLCLALAATAAMTPVQAREPARPQLTLEQATAMAMRHSEAVLKAAREVERTGELRDHSASGLDWVPSEPAGSSIVEVPWAQFLAADLTWEMSKRSEQAARDTVVLDTAKKYREVQVALAREEAAEAALADARRRLQDSRAMFQVGMGTGGALAAAEAQLTSGETSLASARAEVEKAYAAFNQAVGLWPEDRPILVDQLSFQPLRIDSLDYEVRRALEGAPSLWLARQTVKMREILQDMSLYSGQYSPYQVRKIEVEQAGLDAMSAEETFALLTRNLYYAVQALEQGYSAAMAGISVCQENLRVARVRYEVGVGTLAEVTAAEKALAAAVAGADEIAAQHAYMKMAFAKPWAYLASPSTASGH